MPPFIDVDYPLTSEGNTLSADSQNSPVYLIRQTANQNREAFSQLYDHFSSLVYTLAMLHAQIPPMQRIFSGSFRTGLATSQSI